MRQLSVNSSSIREHNLALVLNQIRKAGSISRADIIRETDLSPTAVSALVSILIDTGFVQEVGMGESSGGRPPILLQFDYGSRLVIGVDIGASHVAVIAMDLQGQVRAREYARHAVITDPPGSLALARAQIETVIRQSAVRPALVLGIGVTVPTPLEGEQLDRLMTYYMPAWQDVYPAHALQEWFNLPVYLENDANAGAIAEKWWGGGRDTHSLAYIKLGVGVGSGLIINDEIYRGYSGAAGEIGHTTIEASGRLCRCGNRGCMESYVGAPGLIADTLAGFERNGYAIENPELLTVEQVVQEGLRGNEVCQAVIQNAGRSLGVAVANLLNLVNPGLVILGGDLVQAGDLLFSTVEESIRERALPIRAIHAPVVASQLGENAIAMGSATIVIQKAFQPSALYHTLGLLERR